MAVLISTVTLLTLWFTFVSGQRCPVYWQSRGSSGPCYRFNMNNQMSWQDARDFCQIHGGDLLKVQTAADRNWLVSRVKNIEGHAQIKAGSWWIGLNNREYGTVWEWSDGASVARGVLNWNSGAPANAGGMQRCGVLLSSGKMDDDVCENQHKFICTRDRALPINCDADHGWQTLNYQCYKVYGSKRNWQAASKQCDRAGGSLVTPGYDNEEVAVHDFAVNLKTPLWINFRSFQASNSSSDYYWTADGSTEFHGQTYWQTVPRLSRATRNSSCVVVNNNAPDLYAWTSALCNANRAFVCKKPEGVCFAGWIGHRSYCYQFDTHYKLSFAEASTFCTHQGAELLRIDTSSGQAFIQTYLREMQDSGVQSFWIGASDDNKDGGSFAWRNGRNVSYSYWIGHNSTNTPHKQDCAYIPTSDTRGHWRITSNCQSAKQFVCMVAMGREITPIASTPRPYFGCPSNWHLFNGQCYRVYDTSVDWLTARDKCKASHSWADLATIPDSKTQGFISSHLNLQKDVRYWIGLSDRNVQNTYTWLDDTNNATYSHWKPREPNDYHGLEKCVEMLNGLWLDDRCNRRNHYICSKPSDSINPSLPPSTPATDWTVKCGTGWESNPVTDNCYMFVDEPLSWYDAYTTCRHFRGNLVAIETIDEQNYLAARIKSMTSIAVWSGANDRGHEEVWKWVSGKPFPFFNWAPGKPDDHGEGTDCVALFSQNAQWDDVNCNNRNGYICEKIGRVPHTRGTTTTTQQVPTGMVLGCKPGFKPFLNFCYQFVQMKISSDDAKTRCNRNGGQLVSIHSKSEMDFIVGNLPKFTGGNHTQGYFIGLDDHLQEMQFTWQDGTPVTYTLWNKGEPNSYHNREEDCGEISLPAYKWNDLQCWDARNGYICKKPQAPVSSAQVLYQQGCPTYARGYDAYCYKTVTAKKTWNDANAYCSSTFNGTLAVINDRILQSFLSSFLVYRSGYFWIGLSDTLTQGTYTWANNASVQFTYWHNTHTGNELSTCVAMRADDPIGLWENVDCTTTQGFICRFNRVGFTPSPTQPTIYPNIPCPLSWTEFAGKCYYAFAHQKLTWMEAHSFCTYLGGDLPSIHSKMQDDFLLKTLFSQYSGQSFWIGLNDRDIEDGYVWSDSSALDFTNWKPEEPNDYQSIEDCVEYATWIKQWNDNNCYSAKSFVCSIPKGVTIPPTTVAPTPAQAGTCGHDPNWYYYQDNCYWFSPDSGENSSLTWYEAKDFCTSVGSNLLSIHSMDENQFLVSVVSKRSTNRRWIGLNDLDLNGYTWSDGTPTDFVRWAPSEPIDYFSAERCVTLEISRLLGNWDDLVCSATIGFICKRPLNGPAVVVKPQVYPPGGCKNGFTRVPGGRNKCFFIGGLKPSDRLNWTSARDTCQKFGPGHGIASIEDLFEQEFAIRLIGRNNAPVWIGLNTIGFKTTAFRYKYYWQDSAPVEYLNWDKGQPTSVKPDSQADAKECVLMRVNKFHKGGWANRVCSQPAAYLCQVKQDPQQVIVSPPNSCTTPGYQMYGNSCYKLSSDVLSWTQAQASCQNDGATLASILSIDENAFIYTMTKGQLPHWIGLTDSKTPGLYVWSDGNQMIYSDWDLGEPTHGQQGGCVYVNTDARWNDSACSIQMNYVCKIAGAPPQAVTVAPGLCSNPNWIPDGNFCYFASVNSRNSWPEANYQCRRRNMDLVSVHSQAEMDFIFNLVSQSKVNNPSFTPNIWVGMTRGPDGAFKWSDSSAVNYLYWTQGEPSGTNPDNEIEECVEFNRQSKTWNDVSCFVSRGYVCKASKGTLSTQPPVPIMTFPIINPVRTNPPMQPQSTIRVFPVFTFPPQQTQRTFPPKQTGPFFPVTPANPGPQRVTTFRPPWMNPPSPPVTSYRFTNPGVPPAQWPAKPVGQTQTKSATGTSSSGMSRGAVAGVVIAVLIVLALVVVALVYLKKSGKLMNSPFSRMKDPTMGFENEMYNKADDHKTEYTA